MPFNKVEVESLLVGLGTTLQRLACGRDGRGPDPAERKPLQRMVAADLNKLAELAGLKPIALGGVPLEDDDTTATIGEIPT